MQPWEVLLCAWVLCLCVFIEWLAFGSVCYFGAKSALKRNPNAGIRLPSTMASDEAWLAAHRAAMWHVKVMGVSVLSLAVVIMFQVSANPSFSMWAEGVLFLICLAWILVATRGAVQAARRATIPVAALPAK